MTHSYPLTVTKTDTFLNGQVKLLSLTVLDERSNQFIWQKGDLDDTKYYVAFPEGLQWKAGQFIRLSVTIGNETFEGRYPIITSPITQEPLQIAVTRDTQDTVSEYILDYVNIGDCVHVLPPEGDFIAEPHEGERRVYYFFVGGSGIASVYAMINSILVVEPASYVNLLYAVRDDSRLLLRNELQSLQQQAPENLNVAYLFASPRLLSHFTYWQAGEIRQSLVEQFLREFPSYDQEARYYTCMPQKQADVVQKILYDRLIPEQRIYCEILSDSAE